MAERKAISKKTRFEVFKRDSFACQYCGKAAPDVILHVDHIDPVSKGGGNSIINLITSCADCNGGKSDRKLDDQSILAKQRDQLAALSERREQLELMVQWRTAVMALGNIELEALEAEATDATGYGVNEADRATLKKLLKQNGLEVALKTLRQSFDRYLVWDESGPTPASLSLAYRKVLNMAAYSKLPSEVQAAHYCRGILRNRFPDEVSPGLPSWDQAMEILAAALAYGYDERELKELCKNCDYYEDVDGDVAAFIAFEEYQKAKPPQAESTEARRGFSARFHA